jgi:hypothetical protein
MCDKIYLNLLIKEIDPYNNQQIYTKFKFDAAKKKIEKKLIQSIKIY